MNDTQDASAAEAQASAREHTETAHEPVEVEIERSVRFGRIIITGTILGSVLVTLLSLMFPVSDPNEYDRWQSIGLSIVYGAALGLALSSLLSLLLWQSAKRKHGRAIVVQTDVSE